MGKCHSNAYKTIPYIYAGAGFMPRLELLCDKNEAIVGREAAATATSGSAPIGTSWSRTIASTCWTIAAPIPAHPEPCIAALHARQARDLRETDGHLRRGCPADARCRPPPPGKGDVHVQLPLHAGRALAKDLIGEGRIGTLHHIRANYLQMAGHDPALRPDQAWYSAWPHSGGLQGIGSHAIDQCRFLLGEIKSVSALVRAFHASRAIASAGDPSVVADDGAAAVLDFENGALGALESSVVATGHKNYLSWEINGSKGSLKWDMEHPNSLLACLEGADGAGSWASPRSP